MLFLANGELSEDCWDVLREAAHKGVCSFPWLFTKVALAAKVQSVRERPCKENAPTRALGGSDGQTQALRRTCVITHACMHANTRRSSRASPAARLASFAASTGREPET